MKSFFKKMYSRSLIILIAFILVAVILVGRLLDLQIFKYNYYLDKVLENLMQETVIKAKRGEIYDANMQPLAVNITTYRIFISPADIETEEDRVKIAKKLSELLNVEYDDVYKKTLKKNRKDETIKKNVEKDVADQVRRFISENKYTRQIYLEATTERYYPNNNLASQVIGYLGTDGGLFGLEMQYNSLLKGTDGKYITARDAKSHSMPSKYDVKIDPENGLNVVTTLDVNIQRVLENQLMATYKENMARNDVCGIVMDVKTGAVLAMATNWGFDLNHPFTLTEDLSNTLKFSGLKEGSKEYNELKWELTYAMWKNKCVSDTYEPGSTFKIITTAIGLETGAVTPDTEFTCNGVMNVAGQNIHCHKHSGHGTHSLSYLLQQSCNPAMMQVASKVGRETFYEYFESFGYTSRTGIDLPGEAKGIYHSFSHFNAVELATHSFGQTFRTTPIQQISAICSVANGGNLITPHVVSSLVDNKGNVVVSYENKESKRQVVSSQVCKDLSKILEGGTIEGIARNAYVAGYHVAAKTGTSEKRDAEDKSLRIGSTVAYAPADDPEIAILIVVDEPGGATTSGGVVAAPYVANVMEQSLQYLGVGRDYSEEELSHMNFEVGDYVGKNLTAVKEELMKAGVKYKVIGDGDKISAQLPLKGEKTRIENGVVYLYAYNSDSGEIPTPEYVNTVVPDVKGYKVASAIIALNNAGLNIQIKGSLNYEAGSGSIVMSQSIKGGTTVPRGTVIVIESIHTDVNDND